MKEIRREVFYPHPPERVWLALTDPDVLATWLMASEGLEPTVDCEFRFTTKPAPGFDGVIHCKVIEVVPMKRFVYTWASGKMRESPTTVAWTLVPESGGTRLILEHSGFRRLSGFVLRAMLAQGWTKKMRTFVGMVLDRLAASNDSPEAVRATSLRSNWP